MAVFAGLGESDGDAVGPGHDRRRAMLSMGVAMTVAFVALRALNAYGDPSPWTAQAREDWWVSHL